ncbi:MAG: hypothetical protein EOP08_13825 [Proteobacteria bacterium]|nr:MAG: hypothetical protein EOP08_13825 [Pseudomonadota bacterium]
MPPDLPPRLELALEIIYRIEGVAAAKIWQWENRVAVAVRGVGHVEEQLLRRVEASLVSLAEPNETWDYGILVEE